MNRLMGLLKLLYAQKFGLGEPVPEPTKEAEQPKEEDQSFLRSVADVPLSVGRGAVQGVRFWLTLLEQIILYQTH
jgi:hypothetical protein